MLQLLLSSALFGASCSYLALKKQKNPFLWFAIGFCFGIFGLAFLLVQILNQSKQKKVLAQQGPEKQKDEPIALHALSIYAEKVWYYVDANSQQVGPISHDLLKEKIRNGTISLSFLVWNESLAEWKKLQELLC